MPPKSADFKPECSDCPALRALQRQLAALQRRLDELEKQPAQSVAPFRRPEDRRVADKRKPGRKPGHAPAHREPPE